MQTVYKMPARMEELLPKRMLKIRSCRYREVPSGFSRCQSRTLMTPAVFIFCSFVFSEKTVKNFAKITGR